MTPSIARAMLADAVQMALDESVGVAECPYCGNDADFAAESVNADGGAWLVCGCCGNRGRLTPRTVGAMIANYRKETNAKV